MNQDSIYETCNECQQDFKLKDLIEINGCQKLCETCFDYAFKKQAYEDIYTGDFV